MGNTENCPRCNVPLEPFDGSEGIAVGYVLAEFLFWPALVLAGGALVAYDNSGQVIALGGAIAIALIVWRAFAWRSRKLASRHPAQRVCPRCMGLYPPGQQSAP